MVININSKKKVGDVLLSVALRTGKYVPMIRSRHPSHAGLRRALPKLPFRSVIRLGSLTVLEDDSSKKGNRVELNSALAIKNSSSKLKMKQCFTQGGVKTAEWIYSTSENDIINWLKEYPIVAKSHMGSRGRGNTLLKTEAEVRAFIRSKDLSHYIFEKYYNYNKEYRLHVSADGCFYACRKMLKNEFKDHPNAWQRHDDNCSWILEENEMFDKPTNWANIIDHCVKALISCGLDFGACDLRVQNNIDKEGVRRLQPDFIVVEINSAPSFGKVTLEKYKEVLPQLLVKKHENR
jgi:hypothetical protein